MKNILTILMFAIALIVDAQEVSTITESPLKGKIINVIGDSYVKNHRRPSSEAWHALVAERNGMTYRNYGRNGNCIVFDREAEGWGKPMLERYKEMNDTADYVLVIAGHNDAFFVGNSEEKLQEFRDGLRLFCQLLIEKYPNAIIAFVTPWNVQRDGFAQTIRAIKETCADFSIPCLDAASTGGIDPNDEGFRKQYFQGPNDTAHLNAKGHELFYPTGLQFFLGLKPRQDAEQAFLNPPHEAPPLMIWQWMDGMVNEEGITASLEAYKEAGLGGVQQFLVGGDMQTVVRDTTNAIGTENWRRQMAFAIEECKRLGLSFGTHNCPGWSSSAFPSVRPEYSMQKVVWSIVRSETLGVRSEKGKAKKSSKKAAQKPIVLPRPEIDTLYDYYKDIAVVAIPDRDTVSMESVIVLKDKLSEDGTLDWTVPEGAWRIYRFGHTTNGKQNIATAPYGGVGLECDKMSREAVDYYWSTYPSMLLKLAGAEAGKTFQRLEIDSYEAGGQEWSPVLPEEFQKRCKYDILPWLPVMAGVTVGGEEATKQFRRHWQNTVQDLFAENYYGYMSELAHRHGIKLMVQPYGTGSSRPFNPINTDKIVRRIAADDPVCAEFWTKPNWGWKDVPRVVNAARGGGHEIVYAEGFTCWPFHAWKDDPDDLKRVADRAFCLGINALMLHAGALNPWTNHKPGMTFGKWGTQWTPNLTWWESGGAKALFDYMTRCQSLLQRGRFVDDFNSKAQSLSVEMNGDNSADVGGEKPAADAKVLQWTHRRDGEADIYFIANTSDATVSPQITIAATGRTPEIWNPEKLTISNAGSWTMADGKTKVSLDMNAGDALFLVFRKEILEFSENSEYSELSKIKQTLKPTHWILTFPDEDIPTLSLDTLTSWHESDIDEVKYSSFGSS